MKIRLAENFRAIFYAPFYALRALDLAAVEGVDIEWLAPRSPGGAIENVKSGAVDVTWGGPMRAMKDHDTTPANGTSLVCFGEVVARDPFYLVGKINTPNFDLVDLATTRLGVVSEVPTPWLCLQADLMDRQVDTWAMRKGALLNCSLSMPEQLRALKNNFLDVGQFFEPYVSQAVAEGIGKILYAACDRGPTVYTTFICSRDGLERNHETFARLYQTLKKLEAWIQERGPDELAKLIVPYFPEVPLTLLHDSVRRYFFSGIWSRSPEVSQVGFDRLAQSLQVGGFIKSRIAYESCVHRFDAVDVKPLKD